jgi:hypothetical protein
VLAPHGGDGLLLPSGDDPPVLLVVAECANLLSTLEHRPVRPTVEVPGGRQERTCFVAFEPDVWARALLEVQAAEDDGVAGTKAMRL